MGLTVAFDHVGPAATLTIACVGCTSSVMSAPTETALNAEKKSGTRLTSSSVNILCVSSFLTVGDGGAEAQRLAGFLGLPRNASMEKSIFSTIEKKTSPAIEVITEDILFKNSCQEVKGIHAQDVSFDFEAWKKACIDGDTPCPESAHPEIGVSRKEAVVADGIPIRVTHHSLAVSIASRKSLRCCQSFAPPVPSVLMVRKSQSTLAKSTTMKAVLRWNLLHWLT